MEEKVQDLNHQINERLGEVGDYAELLEQANILERAGLGEAELARLLGMLAQIADSQKIAMEDAVPKFFETASRLGPLVSLELEIGQSETRAETARAEAEHWEAEAQQNEDKCSARSSTIDAVEGLLNQGVIEENLIHWENILDRAGITDKDLSGSLDQYGSLKALAKARQDRADELQAQIPKLESQVHLLTEQRDSAGAAVQAVRKKALEEVTKAGRHAAQAITKAGVEAQRVVESLNAAGLNYGDVRHEAATLREFVELARALATEDPEVWRVFPNQVIKHVISGVLTWAQGEGRNIQLLHQLCSGKEPEFHLGPG